MNEPTITFRGVRSSAALKTFIRDRVTKLETYKHPIIKCHVTVETADLHHKKGNRYVVHLDLTVPGGTIAVRQGPNGRPAAITARRTTRQDVPDPEHKHVRIALRDAIAAAKRQLQDFARRQRGD